MAETARVSWAEAAYQQNAAIRAAITWVQVEYQAGATTPAADETVQFGTGNAVAAGVSGGTVIETPGADEVLDLGTGNAVAAGLSGASVDTEIQLGTGNAVADGLPVLILNDLDYDRWITFTVGTAIAQGYKVSGLYWMPAYGRPTNWLDQGTVGNEWLDQGTTNSKWVDVTPR